MSQRINKGFDLRQRKVNLLQSGEMAAFGGSTGQPGRRCNNPGVLRAGENVLFPAHEGRLSSGHAIDRHGDPDLMAEFSAEYLKQYRAILPKGRLPRTVSEMMPALHLLMNAAELAIKADLIRSSKESRSHTLLTPLSASRLRTPARDGKAVR